MSAKDGNFTHTKGVTLREYFEARFDAMDKALELARAAISERLASMNEFRETLREQATKFVTKAEIDQVFERIGGDIKILTRAKDQLEGKASQQTAVWGIVFGVSGLIIGLIAVLLGILKR